MGSFRYELEPKRDILFIDVKSFYASVECVQRGFHPMKTMLVVMSQSDNTGNGLVLAASPLAKRNWESQTLLVLIIYRTIRSYSRSLHA